MAAHADQPLAPADRLRLPESARAAHRLPALVGLAGLALALLLALFTHGGAARFYFAYLISFCFFLSLALGGLFFLLLQHLAKAGWSVSVRRLAENFAATLPILALLSLPILFSVIQQKGLLYPWALPLSAALVDAHADASHADASHAPANHADAPAHPSAAHAGLDKLTLATRAYLNPPFFILRILFYFALWSAIALWYFRQSTQQDLSGDLALTRRMQSLAAPALLALGVTVTFAAFDLLMSLDPHWFSTIFGVYFIAGSAVAGFASLILLFVLLQSRGYLVHSITPEHYHDLGKYLFGFVFFWGYIAFSQYMLIWYASIPEETAWLARRGATSVFADINAFTVVSLLLLFGHLLIPFAGLLSRSVKRKPRVLAFWALWLLVFHWLDLYWLAMPELDGHLHLGLPEVATFLGLGGLFSAAFLYRLSRHNLRPLQDPRLEESLVFQNI